MSPAIVTLVIFLGFTLLGVPIAFALGIGSLIGLHLSGVPLVILPQRLFSQTNSFLLLSIPFFIIAGDLMTRSGITQRLVNLANKIIGRQRAGLAQVSILVSMLFAGITGLAQADAAAIGSIMIPAMTKSGYEKRFSASVVTAASSIGPIIPPSVPAIIYASVAGVSVGRLFLAGALPGIALGLGFMIVVDLLARFKIYSIPEYQSEKISLREVLLVLRDASLALLAPIVIVGGIIGGFVTATEASAIAVLYSLIVGIVFYRTIKMSDMIPMIKKTASTTGMVVIVMGLANGLGWVMTNERIPHLLATLIAENIGDKIIFMFIVILVLLFVGMILNTSSAIIILAPILAPVAYELGIDSIQFGELIVATLVVGLLTPPVGLVLYIISSISKCSIEEITRGIIPFLIVCLLVLALIALIPAFTTFLPNWLYSM